MMQRIRGSVLVLAGVLAALSATTRVVSVQSEAPLAGAPITHLGIVVPDVARVAAGYADAFGEDVSPIRTIALDLPNGKKAQVKVAYVPLPNFYLEVLEPVTKAGPIYEHLQKYGRGVHHFGLGVDQHVDAVRATLEQRGGKWTAGKKGGSLAYVDFRQSPLGATIEVGPSARPDMPAAPSKETSLFGGKRLGHFGFCVTDIDASLKGYTELLGLTRVEPRRWPPEGTLMDNPSMGPAFPPGNKYDPDSYVRTMMMQAKGVDGKTFGFELIQPIGGATPWGDHIKKQKGSSINHIGVGRGAWDRDEWVKAAQAKGAEWTLGGPPPDKKVYLDFSATLGLTVE